MQEIEIKLRAGDLPALRKKLRELGFRQASRRELERNLLFDTPDHALGRSSQLLRLRSKGKHWWLTFKSRPLVQGRHKVREEHEVEVNDGEELAQILRRIGYHPAFEYQKYRTEYRHPRQKGKILLDETPIGDFVELEGPPEWIDRVARQLGYAPEEYILLSYGALYLDWCRQRSLSPGQMVFSGKKSLRPAARLRHSGKQGAIPKELM